MNYTLLNKGRLKKLEQEFKELQQKNKSESEKNGTKKVKRETWDPYNHHVENFSRRLELNKENFLLAMGISYSWMPTMLDIYVDDFENLDKIVDAVRELGSLSTFEKLNEKENCITNLNLVSSVINNSIVGASKVMHLFYPTHVPIIDSRVIRAWKEFFKGEVDFKIANSANGYLNYWKCLLRWKENIEVKTLEKFSVRVIEKMFFDYGGLLPSKS